MLTIIMWSKWKAYNSEVRAMLSKIMDVLLALLEYTFTALTESILTLSYTKNSLGFVNSDL